MSNCVGSDLLLNNKYEIAYALETQAHYFPITGYNACDELRDLSLKQTNDQNRSSKHKNDSRIH